MGRSNMVPIIIYEIAALIVAGILLVLHNIVNMPEWYVHSLLFIKCGAIGAIGGVLYCLRAIYLNKAVRKTWSSDWYVWYYLRPLTSFLSGAISAVMLKAGLLLLEASSSPESIPYGFLALAFIAGYNVDNFMKKIEALAHTAWGIEKSRVSKEEDYSS